jgi:hypothetical protein
MQSVPCNVAAKDDCQTAAFIIAFGHTTRHDPIAIGPTKYDDVWFWWQVAGMSTALARQR